MKMLTSAFSIKTSLFLIQDFLAMPVVISRFVEYLKGYKRARFHDFIKKHTIPPLHN